MGGTCSTNGAKTNTYRLLVRKPEGKRLLGRYIHRWVDIIKMDLEEWCLLGCYAVWLL
jgi:hypothetical protein